MKQPLIYRQGDVLLQRVDSIPAGAKPKARDNGRIILAYGEVTGHAHQLLDRETGLPPAADDAVMLTLGELETYVRLVKPMVIGHEEHATLYPEVGTYLVHHQREYTPWGERRVLD